MTARTLHGTSINRFLVLNPPDLPPSVYNPSDVILNSCGHQLLLEASEERCRNCQSIELVTDSSQGDRVCLHCGHVLEGHVLMDPEQLEWKEKSAVTSNDMCDAHCKRVHSTMAQEGIPTEDESKTEKALQFNTSRSVKPEVKPSQGRSIARIRSRRCRSSAVKCCRTTGTAQVPRQVSVTSDASPGVDVENHVGHSKQSPQHQGTKKNQKFPTCVDKWSLPRAIFLHGSYQEKAKLSLDETSKRNFSANTDATAKQAAQDLYTAYSVITQAAQDLQLSSKIMEEAMHQLVKYVAQRDGFMVNGVHSKLSKSQHFESIEEREALEERLKSYIKLKQTSALCAAALFVAAKNQGSFQNSTKICACFHPEAKMNVHEMTFLKPKHLSRAMLELKSTLPEYTTSCNNGVGNPQDCHSGAADMILVSPQFSDQFIQRLNLPPVAEAAIHLLFTNDWNEQMNSGECGDCDLESATIRAAMTYFVCSMGATMQTIAKQLEAKRGADGRTRRREREHTTSIGKRRRLSDDDVEIGSQPLVSLAQISTLFGDQSEKQAYDMRRMWDAWSEQISWSRSPAEIEQVCGFSHHALLDVHQNKLFPGRQSLVCMLQKNAIKSLTFSEVDLSARTLHSAPLASILLGHITSVASLMKIEA